MKLKQIHIQNYKNIEDLNQKIDGNIIVVKGDNNKGKTTFSTAFLKLITKVNKPEIPVTKGKDSGIIKGHFKDVKGEIWTVSYEFTNEKEKLTLITPDGIKTNKVKDIRGLFNYHYVDIDEFIAWSSTADGRRKQKAMILNLLDDDIKEKFIKTEKEEKDKYASRATANLSFTTLQSIYDLSNLSNNEKNFIEHEESLLKASEEIKKDIALFNTSKELKANTAELEDHLSNNGEMVRENIENLTIDIEAHEDAIKELRENIENVKKEEILFEKDANSRILSNNEAVAENDKVFTKYFEPVLTTLEELDAECEGDKILTTQIKAKAELHKKQEVLVKEAKAKAKKYDKELIDARDLKASLIDNAELPIEGLTIGDEEILLHGLPFTKEQLSTSQIMKTVFKIMVAMNKKTPIFHLGRAESLGKESITELIKIAKENDYQVFFDKVESESDLKIEIIEHL